MVKALPEGLEDQLNAERGRVDVSVHNFSVRELVRMMIEEELDVAPAYQRQFRWREEAESLFVESIFLGLPVPPIFVATNVGYQWEVVDGLQRLSTLAHFLAEDAEAAERVGRKTPLMLAGLEKLSQLNGVAHADLPKNLKVYFGRQPLQVVSLTDKSDLEVRFDVFERLNRGGITLSAQEVRACVYRGPFNEFIEELSGNPKFVKLLKLQKSAQTDGTTVEQVLKFFAYKNYRESYDGKVERWLNRSMAAAQKSFDYISERRSFDESVNILFSACGESPLLPSESRVTPLVQFEACLVGIAELLRDGTEVVIPEPGWQDDPELRESSGAGSNSRSMLARRIHRAKGLFSGDA